jgi:thiosulfate reductase cytochrome b subunit
MSGMKRIFIYTNFERFWHWTQALLVILLALTGFELHFHWGILDFATATTLHMALAWAFLVLIAFAIFWHFTTGVWKQYVPGRGNVIAMVMYYALGIFKREPHPVQKTKLSKLNPLQQGSYLALKIVVIPVQVTTGFAYYTFNDWREFGLGNLGLAPVAMIHTFGAFFLMAFMFFHIYLTTMGHSPLSNIKAMITGWEELDED